MDRKGLKKIIGELNCRLRLANKQSFLNGEVHPDGRFIVLFTSPVRKAKLTGTIDEAHAYLQGLGDMLEALV